MKKRNIILIFILVILSFALAYAIKSKNINGKKNNEAMANFSKKAEIEDEKSPHNQESRLDDESNNKDIDNKDSDNISEKVKLKIAKNKNDIQKPANRKNIQKNESENLPNIAQLKDEAKENSDALLNFKDKKDKEKSNIKAASEFRKKIYDNNTSSNIESNKKTNTEKPSNEASKDMDNIYNENFLILNDKLHSDGKLYFESGKAVNLDDRVLIGIKDTGENNNEPIRVKYINDKNNSLNKINSGIKGDYKLGVRTEDELIINDINYGRVDFLINIKID